MTAEEWQEILKELITARDIIAKHYGKTVVAIGCDQIHLSSDIFAKFVGEGEIGSTISGGRVHLEAVRGGNVFVAVV